MPAWLAGSEPELQPACPAVCLLMRLTSGLWPTGPALEASSSAAAGPSSLQLFPQFHSFRSWPAAVRAALLLSHIQYFWPPFILPTLPRVVVVASLPAVRAVDPPLPHPPVTHCHPLLTDPTSDPIPISCTHCIPPQSSARRPSHAPRLFLHSFRPVARSRSWRVLSPPDTPCPSLPSLLMISSLHTIPPLVPSTRVRALAMLLASGAATPRPGPRRTCTLPFLESLLKPLCPRQLLLPNARTASLPSLRCVFACSHASRHLVTYWILMKGVRRDGSFVAPGAERRPPRQLGAGRAANTGAGLPQTQTQRHATKFQEDEH